MRAAGYRSDAFATVSNRDLPEEDAVEVTEATFNDEVIERSRHVPVIVDYWAEWCGPCRQLAPIIEQAVAARDGEIVLAKVNIDQNPRLAQAAQVSSIPAVKAFKDGVVVDEFVGLIPPPQIEEFLNKLVPSQADRLVEIGDEESLREALVHDAGHLEARLSLGRLLVAEERGDEAREVLAPASFHPAAEGILARLDLANAEQPDVAAGLAALDREDFDAALAHLIDAVGVTEGDLKDSIRKTVVGVFGQLGEQHPLTLKHRKRLARTLY
jgi:putative thioredoxin